MPAGPVALAHAPRKEMQEDRTRRRRNFKVFALREPREDEPWTIITVAVQSVKAVMGSSKLRRRTRKVSVVEDC
eukprot:748087-Hanusia_phi.AAC.1